MKTEKQLDKTFDIPQGYFDSLESRIHHSVDMHKHRRRSKTVRMYILRTMGAAALLTGLFFSIQGIWGDANALVVKPNTDRGTVIEITKIPQLPVNSPELEELIHKKGLSVIHIDENQTIIIDSTAIADYLTNNYDIMELATL